MLACKTILLFHVLRNFYTFLRNDYADLCSHRECVRSPSSPSPLFSEQRFAWLLSLLSLPGSNVSELTSASWATVLSVELSACQAFVFCLLRESLEAVFYSPPVIAVDSPHSVTSITQPLCLCGRQSAWWVERQAQNRVTSKKAACSGGRLPQRKYHEVSQWETRLIERSSLGFF